MNTPADVIKFIKNAKEIFQASTGITITGEGTVDSPFQISTTTDPADFGNLIEIIVPTTDPGVDGEIWLDGETLKVSLNN